MNRAQLMSHSILASFILFCLPISTGAQRSTPLIPASPISKAWVADNGDGTYNNPIIHADYSDPDVIRIGDASGQVDRREGWHFLTWPRANS